MSTASDTPPDGIVEIIVSPEREGIKHVTVPSTSPTQKPAAIIASAKNRIGTTFSSDEAKECVIEFRAFVNKYIRKFVTLEKFDSEIASQIPGVMYDDFIAKLEDMVVAILVKDAVRTDLTEGHQGGFNKVEVVKVAGSSLSTVIRLLSPQLSQ